MMLDASSFQEDMVRPEEREVDTAAFFSYCLGGHGGEKCRKRVAVNELQGFLTG